MKKLWNLVKNGMAVICVAYSFASYSQEIFVPSGTVGSSSNNNIGIGVSTPSGDTKLDIDFGLFSSGIRIGAESSLSVNRSNHAGDYLGRLTQANAFTGGNIGQGVFGRVANLSDAVGSGGGSSLLYFVGGQFQTIFDNLNSAQSYHSINYYYAGSLNRISGTVGKYPPNGAVAAVIGLDEVGDDESLAAFFDGKASITDNVSIGRQFVPTIPSSGELKLFVDGSGSTIGNFGHLGSGTYGLTGSSDQWTGLGGPIGGAPAGNYGLKHQWGAYSINLTLNDNSGVRNSLVVWEGSDSKFSIGRTTGSGIIDEQIIIKTNNFVGIGDTDPFYRLELPNSASLSGRARANRWDTYSSKRWKENISTIKKPIDLLMQLEGVEYDWKEEYGGTHDFGFIAEEVGEVFPELVSWDENGTDALGLDYGRIIPLLVEVVKLQQESIVELQKNIAESYDSNKDNTVKDELSENPILYQNTPNPFSSNTTIRYSIPESSKDAYIIIFNLNGNQLIKSRLDPMSRSYEVSSNQLNAGLYYYSLVVDDQLIDTRKMLLTD